MCTARVCARRQLVVRGVWRNLARGMCVTICMVRQWIVVSQVAWIGVKACATVGTGMVLQSGSRIARAASLGNVIMCMGRQWMVVGRVGRVFSFCWCWGQLFGLTYVVWCGCFQAAEVILHSWWVDDWFVCFQAAEMVSCGQWVDDRIPGGGSIGSPHGVCGISVCPVCHGCFMLVGTVGSHGVGERVLRPLFCVEKAIRSLFGGLQTFVCSFSWLSAHVHSCIGAVAVGFACSFIQGCMHAVSRLVVHSFMHLWSHLFGRSFAPVFPWSLVWLFVH